MLRVKLLCTTALLYVFRRVVAPLFGRGHQSPPVETLRRTYESECLYLAVEVLGCTHTASKHAASATQDPDEDCDCGRSECHRSVTHSPIAHYSRAQPKKTEFTAKSLTKTAEIEANCEKRRKR